MPMHATLRLITLLVALVASAAAQIPITAVSVGHVSATGAEQTPSFVATPASATFAFTVVGGSSATTAVAPGTYTINWSGTGSYSGSGSVSWTVAAVAVPSTWWQFEATYADTTGHAVTGTAGASTTVTANAKRGKGMTVTGVVGQGMSAPSNTYTSLSGSVLTVGAWVYQTANTGYQVIVRKGVAGTTLVASGASPYAVWSLQTTNGVPEFLTTDGTNVNRWVSNGLTTLPLNAWTHLLGVYDGSTIKLYVDGALVSTSYPSVGNLTTSTGLLLVGTDGGTSLWRGMLDEVTLMARVPTNTEIVAMSSSTTPSPTLTWSQPAAITYGTTLTGKLNATANYLGVIPAGTFTYKADGVAVTNSSVLSAGTRVLEATFAPTDTLHYSTGTQTTNLVVNQAAPGAPTSITATPGSLNIGAPTTLLVSGGGAGGYAGTPQASLEWSMDGGTTWSSSGITAGAMGGTYGATTQNFTFTPSNAGTYQFRASWLGNANAVATAAYTGGSLVANPKISLWLKGDGNLTDSGTTPKTVTGANGATFGSTTVRDGTGSLNLTGATSYLSTPSNADFDFGAGDFTVETWVYMSTVAPTWNVFYARHEGLAAANVLLQVANGRPQFVASLDNATWGLTLTGSSQLVGNTWYHIAGVRQGNSWKLYVNGAAVASATNSSPIPPVSSAVAIGSASATGSNFPVLGYLDNFKVTKGQAVYTGDFSVPVSTSAINWAAPAAITYPTSLSATQLNASVINGASGTLDYNPPLGDILGAGTRTLNVTFTPTDGNTFTSATKAVSLTVNKAPLTVKADNSTRTWGVANSFTATYTGWVNGDTLGTATTGAVSLGSTATPTSNVGPYTITAAVGTLAVPNYTPSYQTGILTVTQYPQSSPTAISTSLTGGTNVAQAVTVSGGGSGTSGVPAVLEWSTDGNVWSTTGVVAGALSGSLGAASQAFTFTPPADGNYTLRAYWGGNTNCAQSGTLVLETPVDVQGAPPTSLTFLANPIREDQTATVTLVGGTGQGGPVVEWSADGNTWQSSGVTILTGTQVSLSLPAGTYQLRAAWGGQGVRTSWYVGGPLNVELPLDGAGSGVFAHFNFEEGSGATTADQLYGTLMTGTGSWVAGKLGGGMNFNGGQWVHGPSTGYLQVTANKVAVSLWVKLNSLAGGQSILCNYNTGGYGFQTIANGVRFMLNVSSTYYFIDDVGPLSTGVWYHLAGVYDGATLKIYRDGVLRGSVARTGNIRSSGYAMVFGGNPDNAAGTTTHERFNGAIDEVRFFNVPLTQDEVSLLAGFSGAPTSITAAESVVRLPATTTITVAGGGAGLHSPGAALEWSLDNGVTWSSSGVTAGNISGGVGSTQQAFTFAPTAAANYSFRANWLSYGMYGASTSFTSGQLVTAKDFARDYTQPTTTATFVVPNGVTSLLVQAWGAGGGGAGEASVWNAAGGAGGYAQSVISVTPGETLTLSIPAGGGGGSTVAGGIGGQPGPGGSGVGGNGGGGGGGGYAAIWRGSTPLVIAGGGGGGCARITSGSVYVGSGGGSVTYATVNANKTGTTATAPRESGAGAGALGGGTVGSGGSGTAASGGTNYITGTAVVSLAGPAGTAVSSNGGLGTAAPRSRECGGCGTGGTAGTPSSPGMAGGNGAIIITYDAQPVEITWPTPANIQYGTTLSETQLNASTTVSGSFSYSPAIGTKLPTGTHTLTATFTPTGLQTYNITYKSVTLGVEKATLTVTPDAKSRDYNVVNPAFTHAYSGFAPGETASVLTGSITWSSPALQTSAPGVYPITVNTNTLTAAHYQIVPVDGELTVLAVAQESPTRISVSDRVARVGQATAITVSGGVGMNPAELEYSRDGTTWETTEITRTGDASFTLLPSEGPYRFRARWGANENATASSWLTQPSTSLTAYPYAYATAGTYQFTVPAEIRALKVYAWGAGGRGHASHGVGGGGGHIATTITVTPGEVLSIYVPTGGNGRFGGEPGGGDGEFYGGGGFAGIFRAGTHGTPTSQTALVVAGGGGSATLSGNGGGGGSTVWNSGTGNLNAPNSASNDGAGGGGYTPGTSVNASPGTGGSNYALSVSPTVSQVGGAGVAASSTDPRCNGCGGSGLAQNGGSGSLVFEFTATPVVDIAWSNPSPITYGTALGSTQLNATANVPASLVYTPAAGVVLNAGAHALTVAATPSDQQSYQSSIASVSLVVNKAPLSLSAEDKTREYGSNVAYTANYDGWVNGESLATLGGSPSVTASGVTVTSAPGTYTITVAQGTLPTGNYAYSYTTGTLTVTKRAQAKPTTITSSALVVSSGSSASLTVSGGGAHTPVELQASLNGETWVTDGITLVDSTHATFLPPSEGTWQLRARWSEDTNNSASPYSTVSSTVTASTYGSINVVSNPMLGSYAGQGGWKLATDETWRTFGTPVTGLLAGTYVVSIKPVSDWNTPVGQSFNLASGENRELSAIYTYSEQSSAGITNLPAGAVPYGTVFVPQLRGVDATGQNQSWLLEVRPPGNDGTTDFNYGTSLNQSGTVPATGTNGYTHAITADSININAVGTWWFRLTYYNTSGVNPYHEYTLTAVKANTAVARPNIGIPLGGSFDLASGAAVVEQVNQTTVGGAAITYGVTNGDGTLNGTVITATGLKNITVRVAFAGTNNHNPSYRDVAVQVLSHPAVVNTTSGYPAGSNIPYGVLLSVASSASAVDNNLTQHRLEYSLDNASWEIANMNSWSVHANRSANTLTFNHTATQLGLIYFRTGAITENSDWSYHTLSYTVIKANTAVTLTSPGTTYNDRQHNLTSTVSSLVTGPISGALAPITVLSGPAVITNGILSFTGAGEVTIGAAYAGTVSLNPSAVSHTFMVLTNNAPSVASVGVTGEVTSIYGQNVAVTGSVTDADGNLTNIRFKITDSDGVSNPSFFGENNVTGASANGTATVRPNAGSYLVFLQASDNYGLTWYTGTSVAITVNKDSPVFNWSRGVSAYTLPGSLVHNDTIDGLQITIRGAVSNLNLGKVAPVVTTGAAAVSHDSWTNDYRLIFNAVGDVVFTTSFAGNSNVTAGSANAAVTVLVNALPTVTSSISGAAIYGGKLSLSVGVSDADSNTTSVRYSMLPPGVANWSNASTVTSSFDRTGSVARSHSFTLNRGVGTYTFRAEAMDNNGGWFAAQDLTAEVIKADTYVSFPGGTHRTNRTYPLQGTVISAVTQGQVATPVYVINSGPAILAGTTLIPTGTGTVSVTASFLGADTYNPAVPVTATFIITENTLPTPDVFNIQTTAIPYERVQVPFGASDQNADITGVALEVSYNGGAWDRAHGISNRYQYTHVTTANSGSHAYYTYRFTTPGTYDFRVAVTDDYDATFQYGNTSRVTVSQLETHINDFGANLESGTGRAGPFVIDSANRTQTQITSLTPTTLQGDATFTYAKDYTGTWVMRFIGVGTVSATANYAGNASFGPSTRVSTFVVSQDTTQVYPTASLILPANSGIVGGSIRAKIDTSGFAAGSKSMTLQVTEPNAESPLIFAGTAAQTPWYYPVSLPYAGTYQVQGVVSQGQTQIATNVATISVVKADSHIRFATTSGFFVGQNVALAGQVETLGGVYVGPPSYELLSGDATLSGAILTPKASDVVTVRASYLGNTNQYNAAQPITQTIYLYMPGDPIPDLQVLTDSAYVLSHNQEPSSLYGTDLGWVRIQESGTSVPVTLTVRNNGGAPLVISGTDTSNSKMAASLTTTLTTGQTAQLTMTYSPTRVQTDEPYVEILSNDPNKPRFRVPIRAVTYYRIPGSNLPIESLYGATDLPDTSVGQTSTVKFRHSNIGQGELLVTAITSTNTDFQVTGLTIVNAQGGIAAATLPASVPVGAYLELTVGFTPSSAGYKNTTLTVNSNNPTDTSYKVPLGGNGL